MTSQRPSLIRLSSILIRPPATPTPRPPPARTPPLQLPIPIRPRSTPTQTQTQTQEPEPEPEPVATPPRPHVAMASPPSSPAATQPHTATTPPNYASLLATFTNTPTSFNSIPTSPRTNTEEASSASMPNSPLSKDVPIGSPSETINDKAISSVTKVLSRSPSPLTLPPAQITTDNVIHYVPMIEQKMVQVQETVDEPMEMLNTHNNGIASHDKRTNKEHSFESSHSHKKNHSVGNTLTAQTGILSSNEDISENEMSQYKHKTEKEMTIQSSVYLNSNVQGVNNSILCNYICKQNDPGVQLSFSRKANGG